MVQRTKIKYKNLRYWKGKHCFNKPNKSKKVKDLV